ncbi:cytochrome P450 [Mycena belliarum]|uniref:Cytochrome P450 n=1 Tax=Mycena belliarum TaxID=1033014 RepID=A0AAD6XQV2_9AGAR|nr:cytochrome P450 [Mycena belliae]
MVSSPPQYAAAALGAYAIWYLVRRFFVSTPLDNVPGPPSPSFLTGNLLELHDPDGWEFHHQLETNYGQVVKLRGLLSAPHLYVFDPVALHSMLVQDYDYYEEHLTYLKVYGLLWGPGILSSVGQDHHRYRKILSPAFAPSRIREMIPMFYEVAEKARDGLVSPFVKDGPNELDFNNILNRTSLELIGRTGIGYSFDAMIPGRPADDRYAVVLKELVPTVFKLGGLFPLLPFALKIGTPAFRRWVLDCIPWKPLREARDLVNYMDNIAMELVSSKKAAVARGQLEMSEESRDIMGVLLKGNLLAKPGDGTFLTDAELVAQTGMIISAATDTTSSALDRIFHLLALHPDIQEKLRAEVIEAPAQMDYEALGNLPYLDAFIHEVMRLYPPVTPVMFRECVKDALLPLGTPITGVDGRQITAIPVPKGTILYIAIPAANHNPQIWGADALEFRPERWENGRAGARAEKMCGIYGNMMTFFAGERSCLGFQFSLLEIKVVMAVFLRAFTFSPGKAEVKWKLSGIIAVPNVEGEVKLPISVASINHA